MPILLSVLLNEIRHSGYKRISQTVIYLPHFLSWVVIASLTFMMFSQNVGLINKVLDAMGREPVSVLTNKNAFWITLVCQTIWKESGWGTIIFLAAISNIDTQLYEAAVIDGANIFQLFFNVVFPLVKPITATVVITNAMWIWNDYLLPFLIIGNNDSKTLTLSLYYAKSLSGQYGNPWELIFPAVLICVIPILIVFIFLQKNIIEGIAAGAVKG